MTVLMYVTNSKLVPDVTSINLLPVASLKYIKLFLITSVTN